MAGIFISYRAVDTGPYANLLARTLRDKFGLNAVFRDRNEIELGDRFVDEILAELGQCDVVLVLMGASWLTAAGPDGVLRLPQPADLVHREVALALALKKIVVPVVFDGASMPNPEQLPEDLRGIVWRDRYDLNGKYFERDATDLAHRLDVVLAKSARTGPQTSPLVRQLMIVWIGLAVLTVGFSIAPSFSPVIQRSLWVFPGSMSAASFFWWLYWLARTQGNVTA